MRVRIGLVCVCALALAVATTAGGTAAARRPRRCAPAGARILAADSLAQAYAHHGSVFGCVRSSGRRLLLGGDRGCVRAALVQIVALRGRLVADAVETCGVDTGSTQVFVRELPGGHDLASGPAAITPGVESFTTVTSLVLAPTGASAWIAKSHSLGNHSSAISVRRLDHGQVNDLDDGAGIVPNSLRLHGRQLTWRDGRREFSATI